MKTLLEYATDTRLTTLLIKERVKCRRKYVERAKNHVGSFVEDDGSKVLAKIDFLTTIMPCRNRWVRLKNRSKCLMADGKVDKRMMAIKSLKLTIARDRKLKADRPDAKELMYLDKLQAYIEEIRSDIASDNSLTIRRPQIKPMYKSEDVNSEGKTVVTFRPLAMYSDLKDKIILALTGKYLAGMFNWHLHDDILSYRSARNFHGKKHYMTDFNDGVRLIREYRKFHDHKPLYVADCDIKKFFDTINHDIVRNSVDRMLNSAKGFSVDGKKQVMKVLDAYLNSFNFYEDVYQQNQSDDFARFMSRKRRMPVGEEIYQYGWISEKEFIECYGSKENFEKERTKIGVPQGGALSPMIADIVLNDIDKDLVTPKPFPEEDRNKFFVRFCDDMVLMHTDKEECERLIETYCKALKNHHLMYHGFTDVRDVKEGVKTKADFWKVKSHNTFCWGTGSKDSSEWVGFLGYEMRYDSCVRLRKSNVDKLLINLKRNYFTLLRQLNKADKAEGNARKEMERLQRTIGKLQNQSRLLLFYNGLEAHNPELDKQLKWLDMHRTRLIKIITARVSRMRSEALNNDNLIGSISICKDKAFGFSKLLIGDEASQGKGA